MFRALDKREYLQIIRDNFSYFSIKPLVVTPSSEPSHRDSSDEGSQPMFLCRINKNHLIMTKHSLLSRALHVAVENSEKDLNFQEIPGSYNLFISTILQIHIPCQCATVMNCVAI